MTYLDTRPIFGDENGSYVERKPNRAAISSTCARRTACT